MAGACLPKRGSIDGAKPWSTVQPAQHAAGGISALADGALVRRKRGKGEQPEQPEQPEQHEEPSHRHRHRKHHKKEQPEQPEQSEHPYSSQQ